MPAKKKTPTKKSITSNIKKAPKLALLITLIVVIGISYIGFQAYSQWRADQLRAQAANWTWPWVSQVDTRYAVAFCRGGDYLQAVITKPRPISVYAELTTLRETSNGGNVLQNIRSGSPPRSTNQWWAGEVLILRVPHNFGNSKDYVQVSWRVPGPTEEEGLVTSPRFYTNGLKTWC